MLGEKLPVKLENCSIDFLKHASALIGFGAKKIFIDPWQLPTNPPKADFIFVTHEHYDHCDPQKIKEISKKETLIATNDSCAARLSGNIKNTKVGQSINFPGLKVFVVEAYNINKRFHPRGLGMGFVLELEGTRIYHAGDTDFIPEMKELKEIDAALLPIGDTYTMNEIEAAQAANSFSPKIAIPMHFNVVDGTSADPQKFRSLVGPKTRVEILYQ
ncbi:MAG: MBL fold metallo-hydrolase [Candidatus Diapherotrites archaeon]|nr:MBL fold metallo-hydrolase [Candidatus Diapherotrites archaeon]